MINQSVDVDKHLGKDGFLINPFGPNIFHFTLNDNLLLNIENYINDFLNDEHAQKEIENVIVAHSPEYTNNGLHYNTISSGFIKPISPRYDLDKNSYLGNIIYNMCTRYFKLCLENINKDISLRQFLTDKSVEELTFEGVDNTKISVVDIWYVEMQDGDFHAMHDHSKTASVSGGIYLHTPDVPFPQSLISWVRSGNTLGAFNEGSWGLQPKKGDVFIWPSWLSHHVYPFKGKDLNRKMISFNAFMEEKNDK